MKTAFFIFLVVGSAAPVYGRALAAPHTASSQQVSAPAASRAESSGPPNSKRTTPVDELNRQARGKLVHTPQPGQTAAGENHSTNHPRRTKKNGCQQVSNDARRSNFGNALNAYQVGSTNIRDATKVGSVPPSRQGVPARPRNVARSNGPSLDNFRHRSPNPAIVGGSANSKSGGTGTINGSRIRRKL